MIDNGLEYCSIFVRLDHCTREVGFTLVGLCAPSGANSRSWIVDCRVVLMLCDCLTSRQARAQLQISVPCLTALSPHHPGLQLHSTRFVPFHSHCVFDRVVVCLCRLFVILAALETAFALIMAEPSKGKHHYGASKLRHVQRPPDSNMVAPEIQLATAPESDYGGGDDVDISAEDLALMEKLSTKKHAGSLTAPSQARAAPAQTGPFTRPASAKTEEPKVFARQAFHQAPPKRNESAVKPPVHPDTAIPSVETSSKEDRHQGTGPTVRCIKTDNFGDDRTTPLPSSWLGTAERVTEIPPTTLETTQGLVQNQRKHEEHAPVEATRPEPVQ
jgi:hypothetical protein